MPRKLPGLFITGTDTGVGKTYVAAMIARALVQVGRQVGVYKPVASGCDWVDGKLQSSDAIALWEAAGRPGELDHVCPQRFAAPLAPHLAAQAAGTCVDGRLLRTGLEFWLAQSEIVLVEGAGGLMSPASDQDYVLDLAREFGFALVVVAANRLGTINATLQTLMVAASLGPNLSVAGVILNDVVPEPGDASRQSNLAELRKRCQAPVLSHVPWQGAEFAPAVDWWSLACGKPAAVKS